MTGNDYAFYVERAQQLNTYYEKERPLVYAVLALAEAIRPAPVDVKVGLTPEAVTAMTEAVQEAINNG